MDVAIESSGSIARLMELAVKNDLSITGSLPPEVDTDINLRPLTEYFEKRDKHIATSQSTEAFEVRQGIGVWAVNVDFNVK